jgi:hypothetical protein
MQPRVALKTVPRSADHPVMERRAEERYEVQFEARVTSVGDCSHSGVGLVADISSSGISICLPVQLRAGDMVAVEIADSMVYGHVIYSKPDGSSYRTGIEAIRVLLGGTDLSHLLQRILMERLPGIPGLEPSAVHRC